MNSVKWLLLTGAVLAGMQWSACNTQSDDVKALDENQETIQSTDDRESLESVGETEIPGKVQYEESTAPTAPDEAAPAPAAENIPTEEREQQQY